MPPRPPKPCKKPGCRSLSQEANGYCPEHQDFAVEKARQKEKRGGERRESACKRGYGRTWGKTREAALQHNPLCADCKAGGRIEQASLVHHVDENPKNNTRTNLVSLCFDCHEKRHGRKRR